MRAPDTSAQLTALDRQAHTCAPQGATPGEALIWAWEHCISAHLQAQQAVLQLLESPTAQQLKQSECVALYSILTVTQVRCAQAEQAQQTLQQAHHCLAQLHEAELELLAQAPSTQPSVQASLPLTYARLNAMQLIAQAAVHWLMRDYQAAHIAVEQALRFEAQISDIDLIMARYWRATAQLGRGTPDQAFYDFLWASEAAKDKHPGLYALLNTNLGATLIHVGDWQGAIASFEAAIAHEWAVTAPNFPIICRSNLSYTYLQVKKQSQACKWLDEAMGMNMQFFSQRHPGDLFCTVGESMAGCGRLDQALHYAQELLADFEERKYVVGQGCAHSCLAYIALEQGDTVRARHHVLRALKLLRRCVNIPRLWKTCEITSHMHAATGDYFRAQKFKARALRAYAKWAESARTVQLAFAREGLELQLTRKQRDVAQQALSELQQMHTALSEQMAQV